MKKTKFKKVIKGKVKSQPEIQRERGREIKQIKKAKTTKIRRIKFKVGRNIIVKSKQKL